MLTTSHAPTEKEKHTMRIKCGQCCAAMINGVFCHETGCPNSRKRYEDGEWVRYLKCFDCGCDVRQGEVCSCHEPEYREQA